MKTVAEQGKELLEQWVKAHVGVPSVWKASRKAHFATASFLRTDAKAVQAMLIKPPVPLTVWEEQGWLLVNWKAEAFDTLLEGMPLPTGPRDEWEWKLFRYLRYPDGPIPNDPVVLQIAMEASWASAKQWDAATERRVLTISHHLMGRERIALEHQLCRVMKWMITERRNDG